MGGRLLKPRPMAAIEPCATCGREHAGDQECRRCAVCGQVFCWSGDERSPDLFGVERRACGARRVFRTAYADRPRIEYRCRQHLTRSWALFGADWAFIRPIAVYVFLVVAFAVTFWGLVSGLLAGWLRSLGIG